MSMPMPSDPSFIHLAESVLQESLSPQQQLELPMTQFEDDPRIDIRNFAYMVVRGALEKTLGGRLEPDMQLTPTDRAHIQEELGPGLITLSRHIAMANNIARVDFSPPRESTKPAQARAMFQGGMLEVFQAHAQSIPSRNAGDTDHKLADKLSDGILGIAPTGSGKTVIAAKTLAGLGIGLPAGIDKEPLRALIVLPDQGLVNQFLGRRGDDTFRRFFGRDVSMTSYWQHSKDTSGALVVTTRQSLPRAVAEGAIKPDDFDVTFVDEAHHMLGKVLQEHVGKVGVRLFCLTATPAYSIGRDLRHLVSHVEIGSLYSFVREGILNPTRLFTYRAEKEEQSLIAAGLAGNYIKQGRKVVVYCPPGGQSAEARHIAKLINDHVGEKVAEAVGTFERKENDGHLERFQQGALRCLTTVAMLREGWNAEVDVAITVGPSGSLLDLTQKIGRAMRPGDKDTILAEVIPRPRPGGQLTTIWNVFGLDEVVQGQRIGPEDEIFNYDYQIKWQGDSSEVVRTPAVGAEESNESSDPLPLIVRKALAPNQPVRQIMIAPEDIARSTPPQGHVGLSQLALQHNVPAKWLQMKLDAADIPYVGIWRERNKTQFERWYSPEAVQYLAEHPIPEMADSTQMHKKDIAALAGVSVDTIQDIISSLEIVGEEKVGPHRRVTLYYSLEQISQILAEVNIIPVADRSDVILNEIKKQLGHSFVERWCSKNGIVPVEKRRHPAHGIGGIARHITQEEAFKITEARLTLPVATSDFISLMDIARMAGISDVTLRKALTPEERAQVQSMRQERTRVHHLEALPRDVGEAIAKRLAPQPLPPTMVPLGLIAERVKGYKMNITGWLQNNNFANEKMRIRGISNLVSCFSWEAYLSAEARFGLRDGYDPVDPTMIVTSLDEPDVSKWEYAQQIQSLYVAPSDLLPFPTETTNEQASSTSQDTSPEADSNHPPVSGASEEPPAPPPESPPAPAPAEEALRPVPADAIRLSTLVDTLKCTPGAMQWVFQQAEVSKEELYAEEQPHLISHIDRWAARRVEVFCETHITGLYGHSISHTRLAHAIKLRHAEIFQYARRLRKPEDAIRLRRSEQGGEIDLYYNDALARRILAAIKDDIKREKLAKS